MNNSYSVTLTTKNILLSFSTISLFFLALYYSSYVIDIQDYYLFDDYMDITREKNVPTFFSFIIMILVGMVYFLFYKEKNEWKWLVISLFFIYLGFDDMFEIHEHLGSDVGELVTEEVLKTGFVSYYWQVIFMPTFALFGLYIIYITSKKFFEKNDNKGMAMFLGGFAFYAIAIGLDFYEGTSSNFPWLREIFYTLNQDSIIDLMRATEEAIEMLGGTFILASLLRLKKISFCIS